MKKLLLTSTLALFAFSTNAAESYKFDPHHTSIVWTANHFGFSNPSGKFSEVEGDLTLDEKNPAKSQVNVTVKMANLFTGYSNFDNHLKGNDFFNIEKFTTATFVSKKVTISGKNTAKVIGDLTVLGVTKPVTLNVKLNKIAINPISQIRTAGFTATALIKRSDFGIDYAIPSVGDYVKLLIEAEAAVLDGKTESK
ncbi:MAG: polyisoprenoid-binding protein [Rickettsiales bacterium]|nr:polyisoprenoid-binding protein [Rickettsiales bacterium]